MAKRFAVRQLVKLMCLGGIFCASSSALASAFQIWEQDGASVGNYHAGRAAIANDATTAYYNPAGILRIPNQQIVVSDVGILTDIRYRGTVGVSTNITGAGIFPVGPPTNVTAQGGTFSQAPDLHYVAPINNYVGFGLSIVAPFGLRTDYGRTNAASFAANLSSLQVVDLTPSFGIKVYRGLSLGAGLDAERMSAELSQVGTIGTGTNSDAYNKGWSTAYGFHLGAMYQLMPSTRFGLTYNSQVVHHLRGTSRLVGPIANLANGVPLGTPTSITSRTANVHLTLPPFTTLSAFHQINERWAVMGTAIYTQWSVFQNLTLKNAAAANAIITPFGPLPVPSTTTVINVPEHYRNTWNVSVGADFYANEKMTLRGGVGYDQSPVRSTYRDLRVPDNNRVAIALGGHFQAAKTLGVDLGWTHLFMVGTTTVNPPPLATGAQIVAVNGKVNASADVFGAQLTWDIV